jgi:transposase
MDPAQRQAAKAALVERMLCGTRWHEAASAAGLRISRTAAYRLVSRVRAADEAALLDGRHGHPTKVTAPVRAWLVDRYRAAPDVASRVVQADLCRSFGLDVSVSQLNRVRAQLGVGRRAAGRGGKADPAAVAWPQLAGGGR